MLSSSGSNEHTSPPTALGVATTSLAPYSAPANDERQRFVADRVQALLERLYTSGPDVSLLVYEEVQAAPMDYIWLAAPSLPFHDVQYSQYFYLPLVRRDPDGRIAIILVTRNARGMRPFQPMRFNDHEVEKAFFVKLRGYDEKVADRNKEIRRLSFIQMRERLGAELPVARDFIFKHSASVNVMILFAPCFQCPGPEDHVNDGNLAFNYHLSQSTQHVRKSMWAELTRLIREPSSGDSVLSSADMLARMNSELMCNGIRRHYETQKKRKLELAKVGGLAAKIYDALHRALQQEVQPCLNQSASDILPLNVFEFSVRMPVMSDTQTLGAVIRQLTAQPETFFTDTVRNYGTMRLNVYQLLIDPQDTSVGGVSEDHIATLGAVIGVPFGQLEDELRPHGAQPDQIAAVLQRLLVLAHEHNGRDRPSLLLGFATRRIHSDQVIGQDGRPAYCRVAVGLCAAVITFLKLSKCGQRARIAEFGKWSAFYRAQLLIGLTNSKLHDWLARYTRSTDRCVWITLALEAEQRCARRGYAVVQSLMFHQDRDRWDMDTVLAKIVPYMLGVGMEIKDDPEQGTILAAIESKAVPLPEPKDVFRSSGTSTASNAASAPPTSIVGNAVVIKLEVLVQLLQPIVPDPESTPAINASVIATTEAFVTDISEAMTRFEQERENKPRAVLCPIKPTQLTGATLVQKKEIRAILEKATIFACALRQLGDPSQNIGLINYSREGGFHLKIMPDDASRLRDCIEGQVLPLLRSALENTGPSSSAQYSQADLVRRLWATDFASDAAAGLWVAKDEGLIPPDDRRFARLATLASPCHRLVIEADRYRVVHGSL